MFPSFLTLFKRGKYYRVIVAAEKHGRKAIAGERSEAERFSVAALAFCLSHAPAFRECFFCEILSNGITPPVRHSTFKIQVEPSNWADLLIYNLEDVYVIEFKIDAAIANHQNPWANESTFWHSDGKPRGYGSEMERIFPTHTKHFRLVHQNSEEKLDGDRRTRNITLVPVSWTDLHNAWIKYHKNPSVDSDQKLLVADLFDSLGQLGVRTFRHEATNGKTMKSEEQKNAAECGKILTDAAGKIDLHEEAWFLEAKFKDSKSWEFGVDVRAKKKGKGALTKNQNTLVKIIAPSTEYLAWFGYESSEEQRGTTLSVWIYCGNPKSAERVEKRLATLPATLFSVERVDGDKGWNQVVVRGGNPGTECDRDWFVSVFEQLGINSV